MNINQFAKLKPTEMHEPNCIMGESDCCASVMAYHGQELDDISGDGHTTPNREEQLPS